MKFFVVSIVLFCLALPVFSQTSNAQRRKTLSDSMNTTISRSTAALSDFDSRSTENGTVRVYVSYKNRYDLLTQALLDSETKLELLLRSNDRIDYVKEERDYYEGLLNELQTVKTEYDSWLRTVQ
jgi:hypothetical protein